MHFSAPAIFNSKSGLALLTTSLALSAWASDAAIGEEIVKQARSSVVAFECSVLATSPETKAKLFERGLRAGRTYYGLAHQHKAAYEQVWQKIPGPYLRLEGPSVDFLVGRLFHAVEEDLLRLEGKSEIKDEAFQRSEYRKRNCDVL
jgi:hypothetical protein